jgi:hypothetical protein
MAITEHQREICRLISTNRVHQDAAYVAGGVALNVLLDAPRLSLDVDLFHDTREALEMTWDADRKLLTSSGFEVVPIRERPAYVEAIVRKGAESTTLQWTCDSAFRFFPLITHDDLGLTLHPFDLATNKVLALAGRLEARDWVDVVECHSKLQPLGLLAWAASGKDPGISPLLILAEARRATHYSPDELHALQFDRAPDFAATADTWRSALVDAERVMELLPVESVGACVLNPDGSLYRGNADRVGEDIRNDGVRFHRGSIRGAFPSLVS